jgi:hypothetical protein
LRQSPPSAANHICQSSLGMCGVANRGRRSSSHDFQRKRYGFQVSPSSLPSTVISGRSVVMTRNRPYELALRSGSIPSASNWTDARIGVGIIALGKTASIV